MFGDGGRRDLLVGELEVAHRRCSDPVGGVSGAVCCTQACDEAAGGWVIAYVVAVLSREHGECCIESRRVDLGDRCPIVGERGCQGIGLAFEGFLVGVRGDLAPVGQLGVDAGMAGRQGSQSVQVIVDRTRCAALLFGDAVGDQCGRVVCVGQ